MEQYNINDLYQVGSITQTHGIKGEVKVFPLTDDISRFKGMKELLLDTGNGFLSLEVTGVRPQKNIVILKFKGIDNINDIEKYKGKGLYVTAENRVALEEDEYFIDDLIGLKVVLEDDSVFGEITDVLATGANDVYEVKCTDNKLVYIPAIKECILSVDEDAMRIHLMEGLV